MLGFLVIVAFAAVAQRSEGSADGDAAWYARDQGVSRKEAVRRLRIQSEMGGLIQRLRKTHEARLAGIVVDHQPEYRLRVRLTGTLAVPTQIHALGGSHLPVVFETGAQATLAELLASMTKNQAALSRVFPTLAGIGTDESTSEIVMMVYAPTDADAAAAKAKLPAALALLGVPARIEMTSGIRPRSPAGSLRNR